MLTFCILATGLDSPWGVRPALGIAAPLSTSGPAIQLCLHLWCSVLSCASAMQHPGTVSAPLALCLHPWHCVHCRTARDLSPITNGLMCRWGRLRPNVALPPATVVMVDEIT